MSAPTIRLGELALDDVGIARAKMLLGHRRICDASGAVLADAPLTVEEAAQLRTACAAGRYAERTRNGGGGADDIARFLAEVVPPGMLVTLTERLAATETIRLADGHGSHGGALGDRRVPSTLAEKAACGCHLRVGEPDGSDMSDPDHPDHSAWHEAQDGNRLERRAKMAEAATDARVATSKAAQFGGRPERYGKGGSDDPHVRETAATIGLAATDLVEDDTPESVIQRGRDRADAKAKRLASLRAELAEMDAEIGRTRRGISAEEQARTARRLADRAAKAADLAALEV